MKASLIATEILEKVHHLFTPASICVVHEPRPEAEEGVGEGENAEVVEHDTLGVVRAQPLGEGPVAVVHEPRRPLRPVVFLSRLTQG